MAMRFDAGEGPVATFIEYRLDLIAEFWGVDEVTALWRILEEHLAAHPFEWSSAAGRRGRRLGRLAEAAEAEKQAREWREKTFPVSEAR